MRLALLAHMHSLVQSGTTQFIIATHSPILLTFPGASIISFDDGDLKQIELGDTNHVQISKMMLNNPSAYWRHFVADSEEGSAYPG